jgi:ubiquinone/menaquinone biosynthesis C-methylase UbiE
MKQNIYDDAEFFAKYRELRDTKSGLNEVLEQPALRELLPPLAGLQVLDLGCGMGHFAAHCIAGGARGVVGVDISTNMIGEAQRRHAHPCISYIQSAAEDLRLTDGGFDLVVSSLMLHYVRNYEAVVGSVYQWLRRDGVFVYSIEHPVMTANTPPRWVKDESGRKLHWPLDQYGEEGERVTSWLKDGVIKYHRKTSTLLNGLIEAGFSIERVLEPEATASALQERPELVEERRRPPFLLVRARRA